MHDLKAIYDKVRDCILFTSKQYFVNGENTRFYPRKPKMSDLEVICLSITAECTQIDSENLLWSKIQKDYKNPKVSDILLSIVESYVQIDLKYGRK
jgi:hypothetical protein